MSQKIKDDKNRWRNKSVGFRVSPEEWDVFNDKVRLCGYGKKQDYIMECLTNHQITAKGNPLMLTQFRADLKRMLAELERIDGKTELDEAIKKELFAPITVRRRIEIGFNSEFNSRRLPIRSRSNIYDCTHISEQPHIIVALFGSRNYPVLKQGHDLFRLCNNRELKSQPFEL